ncbi:MAG TPA: OmpA family protein [Phaeodactylibacter sp.]|nr:OmpA family protein [Phaeodactylibacter sp.]
MSAKNFKNQFLTFLFFAVLSTCMQAQDYRVQLAAFVQKVPFTHFALAGVMNVYMYQDQNNIYRYYLDKRYFNLVQAKKICMEVKARGFVNAQVVDMLKQKENCGFPCPYITKTRTFSSQAMEELHMRTLFFDFDKSSLSRESKIELNKIYKVLVKNKNLHVMIQGHTDSKGSAAYNVKLSKRRARAARNYLIAKGIPSRRISVKVFGESAPLVHNKEEAKDSPLGRRYNRRVVVALYNEWGEIVRL